MTDASVNEWESEKVGEWERVCVCEREIKCERESGIIGE